jgi:hypothetical protein
VIINSFSADVLPANSPQRGSAPFLPRILGVAALSVAVCGLQGCGDKDQPPEITKQAVNFDEVPDSVRSAARKAIPGVNFNEAWKNVDRAGKLHSFEIRGKKADDGKIREVRVSLTGEILEME